MPIPGIVRGAAGVFSILHSLVTPKVPAKSIPPENNLPIAQSGQLKTVSGETTPRDMLKLNETLTPALRIAQAKTQTSSPQFSIPHTLKATLKLLESICAPIMDRENCKELLELQKRYAKGEIKDLEAAEQILFTYYTSSGLPIKVNGNSWIAIDINYGLSTLQEGADFLKNPRDNNRSIYNKLGRLYFALQISQRMPDYINKHHPKLANALNQLESDETPSLVFKDIQNVSGFSPKIILDDPGVWLPHAIESLLLEQGDLKGSYIENIIQSALEGEVIPQLYSRILQKKYPNNLLAKTLIKAFTDRDYNPTHNLLEAIKGSLLQVYSLNPEQTAQILNNGFNLNEIPPELKPLLEEVLRTQSKTDFTSLEQAFNNINAQLRTNINTIKQDLNPKLKEQTIIRKTLLKFLSEYSSSELCRAEAQRLLGNSSEIISPTLASDICGKPFKILTNIDGVGTDAWFALGTMGLNPEQQLNTYTSFILHLNGLNEYIENLPPKAKEIFASAMAYLRNAKGINPAIRINFSTQSNTIYGAANNSLMYMSEIGDIGPYIQFHARDFTPNHGETFAAYGGGSIPIENNEVKFSKNLMFALLRLFDNELRDLAGFADPIGKDLIASTELQLLGMVHGKRLESIILNKEFDANVCAEAYARSYNYYANYSGDYPGGEGLPQELSPEQRNWIRQRTIDSTGGLFFDVEELEALSRRLYPIYFENKQTFKGIPNIPLAMADIRAKEIEASRQAEINNLSGPALEVSINNPEQTKLNRILKKVPLPSNNFTGKVNPSLALERLTSKELKQKQLDPQQRFLETEITSAETLKTIEQVLGFAENVCKAPGASQADCKRIKDLIKDYQAGKPIMMQAASLIHFIETLPIELSPNYSIGLFARESFNGAINTEEALLERYNKFRYFTQIIEEVKKETTKNPKLLQALNDETGIKREFALIPSSFNEQEVFLDLKEFKSADAINAIRDLFYRLPVSEEASREDRAVGDKLKQEAIDIIIQQLYAKSIREENNLFATTLFEVTQGSANTFPKERFIGDKYTHENKLFYFVIETFLRNYVTSSPAQGREIIKNGFDLNKLSPRAKELLQEVLSKYSSLLNLEGKPYTLEEIIKIANEQLESNNAGSANKIQLERNLRNYQIARDTTLRYIVNNALKKDARKQALELINNPNAIIPASFINSLEKFKVFQKIDGKGIEFDLDVNSFGLTPEERWGNLSSFIIAWNSLDKNIENTSNSEVKNFFVNLLNTLRSRDGATVFISLSNKYRNALAVNYVLGEAIPNISFDEKAFAEQISIYNLPRQALSMPFQIVNGEAVVTEEALEMWFHVMINELKDLTYALSKDPVNKLNGTSTGQVLGFIESSLWSRRAVTGKQLTKSEILDIYFSIYKTYDSDGSLPDGLTQEQTSWLDQRVKDATSGVFSTYQEFKEAISVPSEPATDAPQGDKINALKPKQPPYAKTLLQYLLKFTTSEQCRAKANEALNNGFNFSIEQITKLCTEAPVKAFGIQFDLKPFEKQPEKVLAFLRILKPTEEFLQRPDIKQEAYIQNFLELAQEYLKEPIEVSEKKVDKAYMANRGLNGLFLMPGLFNNDSYGDLKKLEENNELFKVNTLLFNEIWDLMSKNMAAERPEELAFIHSPRGQTVGAIFSYDIWSLMTRGRYLTEQEIAIVYKRYGGPEGENIPSTPPLPEQQIEAANRLVRIYTRGQFNTLQELEERSNLFNSPQKQPQSSNQSNTPPVNGTPSPEQGLSNANPDLQPVIGVFTTEESGKKHDEAIEAVNNFSNVANPTQQNNSESKSNSPISAEKDSTGQTTISDLSETTQVQRRVSLRSRPQKDVRSQTSRVSAIDTASYHKHQGIKPNSQQAWVENHYSQQAWEQPLITEAPKVEEEILIEEA